MDDFVFVEHNHQDKAELMFCKLESYDDFEAIEQLLIILFGAKSIARWIGPESKIWEFEINGVLLKLHNNPYGNSIFAVSKEEREILKLIFNELKNKLKV